MVLALRLTTALRLLLPLLLGLGLVIDISGIEGIGRREDVADVDVLVFSFEPIEVVVVGAAPIHAKRGLEDGFVFTALAFFVVLLAGLLRLEGGRGHLIALRRPEQCASRLGTKARGHDVFLRAIVAARERKVGEAGLVGRLDLSARK